MGETITFTASGVVDSGGQKRENCVEMPIPAVAPTYTWVLSIPPGYPEPLPTLSGTGAGVSVEAKVPGAYSATFVATPARDCPPPSITIGPESAEAEGLKVVSVTFSGTGMSTISRDDGSGPYPAPHWQDLSVPPDADNNDIGDHAIPVAYVRGTTMAVSAVFSVTLAQPLTGPVTVTGTATAPGGPYVFETTATVAGGTITITDVPADKVLVNTVEYFDPMTIDWTITPSAGETLDCDSLSTSHQVYVTLGAPIAGTTLYETVVHLGSNNGIGYTTEADVIAVIWACFTDREVRRKPVDGFNNVDGHQLTSYQNWDCTNTSTVALLAGGDGQCGSWAKLFIDAMGAQGIDHTNEYIKFETDLTELRVFSVFSLPIGRTQPEPGSAATPITHTSSFYKNRPTREMGNIYGSSQKSLTRPECPDRAMIIQHRSLGIIKLSSWVQRTMTLATELRLHRFLHLRLLLLWGS